jgi:hypothetical protein
MNKIKITDILTSIIPSKMHINEEPFQSIYMNVEFKVMINGLLAMNLKGAIYRE